MADSRKTPKDSSSGFFRVLSKAFDLVGGVGLLFAELKESIVERWDWFLRRVEYIFVVYLWVSVGILFMILGIFDLLTEFGRVPKGVVFSVGGLLIFLVAVIFLQAAKIVKRGDKK